MRAPLLLPLLLMACGLDPLKIPDSGAAGGDDGGGSVMVGDLSITPGTVDFGTVAVGAAAPSATLVVRNEGDDPIVFRRTLLEGDPAFRVADQTTLPVEMGSGDEVVITLELDTAVEGSFAGSLALDVASEAEPYPVPLTGVVGAGGADGGADGGGDGGGDGGATPGLEFSPGAANFNQVAQGSLGSVDLRVTNGYGQDILVRDIAGSPSVFGWARGGDFNLPQTFSADTTKTLTLTFQPTAQQVYTGTVDLQVELADGTVETVSVPASGEGIEPDCTICAPIMNVTTNDTPTTLSITEPLGCSRTETFSVRNSGDQDLVISSVYVTNDAIQTCGTLSISGGSSATVPPGGSASFGVTYTATAFCTEIGVLDLDYNIVHILNNTVNNDYRISVTSFALCAF
jgi:hypothetical protein